jgi:GDP-L-fucose synthase
MKRHESVNDRFWEDRKVLVTGGAGFIGSHLVESLLRIGAKVRVADSAAVRPELGSLGDRHDLQWIQADLLDYGACLKACSGVEIVLNLAAKVAGVAFNSKYPAEMFHSNVRIGLNMLEAARSTSVDTFLVVSSACVYSRDASVPTPENEGFLGDPEPSNLGYGWAKRVLELQGSLYASQYGMKIGIVRPFNTYGPRDHFDGEFGHVIPSLIKKVCRGDNPLQVWGSGAQTRSFIFVTDVVKGMLRTVEKYPIADPLNIGSDQEISIAALAEMIVKLSGSDAPLVYDLERPSGQPRRCPDIMKAKAKTEFEATVSLTEGLNETIGWYRKSQEELRCAQYPQTVSKNLAS